MKSVMKRPVFWAIVGVVLLGALVLFLRPSESLAPNSEAAAQPAAVDPSILIESAPQAVSMVAQETPAQEQPETSAPVVADTPSSDNCIACHTNQAVLEQLAEEPEEVVSELAAGEG